MQNGETEDKSRVREQPNVVSVQELDVLEQPHGAVRCSQEEKNLSFFLSKNLKWLHLLNLESNLHSVNI